MLTVTRDISLPTHNGRFYVELRYNDQKGDYTAGEAHVGYWCGEDELIHMLSAIESALAVYRGKSPKGQAGHSPVAPHLHCPDCTLVVSTQGLRGHVVGVCHCRRNKQE